MVVGVTESSLEYFVLIAVKTAGCALTSSCQN